MSLEPITNPNKEMKEVTKRSRGLLGSRYGLWFLGIVSFVESVLLIPLITDPFLVAYIILHRKRVVTAVIVTTFTSIIGGVIAYVTATFFIDVILGFLSSDSVGQFYNIVERFRDSTFALGLVGAITPVPFTLAALAAGAIKGNLILFLIGVFIGRSIRYGIAGYLTYKYGEDAVRIARGNIYPITIITLIVVAVYLWLTL
ncbi:MAG: VTT domain-containing protein [Candidatus Paceibacterota bacterium]